MNREERLYELTRLLTLSMIPYNPPPRNTDLLEKNNPRGYALLLEYLELRKEEKGVK